MATRAYTVKLNGTEIDTVFQDATDTVEDVKRSLVEHDGYDPAIEVETDNTIAGFVDRNGITLTAERITRDAWNLGHPNPDTGDKPQPSRTYWIVTLHRDGASLTERYSNGIQSWDGVKFQFHRQDKRNARGFYNRCASDNCAEVWPCADVLKHGTPKPPEVADVLDCLAGDALGWDNARGFEDWAGDYGYDPDSRTAERIYQAVAETARNLRALLGPNLYRQLTEEIERL